MTATEPSVPPNTECAHCPAPATRMWRLLGGDGPMGFGYRPMCDAHYEAETEAMRVTLAAALEAMRSTR